MNILFVGGHYVSRLMPFFQHNSKGSLDYAAHNFQEALFQGWAVHNTDVTIISAPFLGSFPPYFKTPFVKGERSSNNKVISVPYLNVSLLKRFDIEFKCGKEIFRWCKRTSGDRVVIFYNFGCISVIPKLKKKFPNIKVCLLVTDLPEYMSANSRLLTKVGNKLGQFDLSSDFRINQVDSFVLLSNAMKEKLCVGTKPSILIEGIFNTSVRISNTVEKFPEKTLLYSGNLGRRYGICDLLSAFALIKDPDFRLLICGKGDGLEDVLQAAKDDSRIKYLGLLSRKDVLLLQKKATILINPRHSRDMYTKYSFPSKTMEYMASGTPTLMSRLESIPEDYYNFLYFFQDESIQGMSNSIVEICRKSNIELHNFGLKASEFILTSKDPSAQIARLNKFLEQHLSSTCKCNF